MSSGAQSTNAAGGASPTEGTKEQAPPTSVLSGDEYRNTMLIAKQDKNAKRREEVNLASPKGSPRGSPKGSVRQAHLIKDGKILLMDSVGPKNPKGQSKN